jgi:hypothetical protein
MQSVEREMLARYSEAAELWEGEVETIFADPLLPRLLESPALVFGSADCHRCGADVEVVAVHAEAVTPLYSPAVREAASPPVNVTLDAPVFAAWITRGFCGVIDRIPEIHMRLRRGNWLPRMSSSWDCDHPHLVHHCPVCNSRIVDSVIHHGKPFGHAAAGARVAWEVFRLPIDAIRMSCALTLAVDDSGVRRVIPSPVRRLSDAAPFPPRRQ